MMRLLKNGDIINCGRASVPSTIALVFFCVLQVFNAWGQSGYSKDFIVGRAIWFKDVAYSNESNLLIVGEYYNDTSNRQNIILLELDTNGNIKKTFEITDPLNITHLTMRDESDFILNKTQEAVIPFSFYDRPTMGISIINIELESILIREIGIDSVDNMIPFGMLEVNSGYLVTGWWDRSSEIDYDAFLLKLDMAGNVVWAKGYGNNESTHRARSITKINDNFFLLSGASSLDTDEKANSWALAIDSSGNSKWEWQSEPFDVNNNGIRDLIYDSLENKLRYISFKYRETTHPDESFIVHTPVYFTCDTTFNNRTHILIEPPAIRHWLSEIEISPDGGVLLAGNTTLTNDSFISPVKSDRAEIIKFSNLGEQDWVVLDTAFFHPEDGSENRINGICVAPNGTTYAVGEAEKKDEFGIERSYGWLLKISPDGCVDTICTTSTLFEHLDVRRTKYTVFPNPATDRISISGPDDAKSKNEIRIYDRMGIVRLSRSIDSARKIDITGLVPGVYYWVIEDQRGFILAASSLMVE